MGQNQNDQRNQQSGNRSQPTQDGANRETNPNNPTANEGTRQDSQPDNRQDGRAPLNEQRQNSDFNQGQRDATRDTERTKKMNAPQDNSAVLDEESTEEETEETSEESSEQRKRGLDSERNESKSRNQNSQNRNM